MLPGPVHLAALALLLPVPCTAFTPAADTTPCAWCADEPERLAGARAIGHGPFPIARTTSAALAEQFDDREWLFLETPHFRIAWNLPASRITRKDAKVLEPDIARLRAVLIGVPERISKLPSGLRLHLMGQLLEDTYDRFQELADITDADFLPRNERDPPWMGAGPFLGELDKFEFVYHADRETHEQFTRECTGVRSTDALRWHFSPAHKLMASIPAEDPDLRQDRWLRGHSVHLASHLMFCAYKHFTYDPPLWMDEGLAHALERELEPASTTIDTDEGAGADRPKSKPWTGRDKKLVKRDKAPRVSTLMRIQSFADMDEAAHITSWSILCFMIEKHPAELAAVLGGVKGQLNASGVHSGGDLPGLQRRLFKEILGWSPAEFDSHWQAWVLEER